MRYLLLFLLGTGYLHAQTYPRCSDRNFVFSAFSNISPSEMFVWGVQPAGGTLQLDEITVNPDLGMRLNAVGYSIIDNHLYGIAEGTFDIWRVSQDGQLTNLGRPANIDTTLTYTAGEIAPDGRRLYLIGHDPTINDDLTIFNINVHAPPPLSAGTNAVISDQLARVQDFAWRPKFGTIVGFDAALKKLVEINIFSGQYSDFAYVPLPGIGNLESIFFDKQGRLFGYGGPGATATTTLYQFNPSDGSILSQTPARHAKFADACSCAHRIWVEKRVEPATVLPCSEVTITYRMFNEAGTAYSGRALRDTLPAGFVITEVLDAPGFSNMDDAVGTNIVNSAGYDFLLGGDSLVIRVEVGDVPPGAYSSQAWFGPFPRGLGGDLRSDDPRTAATEDPTAIRVRTTGELFSADTARLCPGGRIDLTPGGTGIDYLWSTGDTTPTLTVGAAGDYWCEILADCGLYRDTITVVWVEEALSVDVGPDRETNLGIDLLLGASLNVDRAVTYAWTTSDSTRLSCTDCPAPSLLDPTDSVRVRLTVRDAFGCSATDELRVSVSAERNVYMPSGFSPNDDGRNDWFFVNAPANYRIRRFLVRDRWGTVLFYTEESQPNLPETGWNGRVGNRPLDTGIYVWLVEIDFPGGGSETFTGDVLLLR